MADVTKGGIVVSPGSGSGDTTLTVKAQTANQGNRVTQSQTFTVTVDGVAPQTFKANLVAANEFVQFTNGSSMAVGKEGGNVTITGTSNSSKLTFTKGTGSIITADISAVKYQAGGVETTNGVAITGDPGAKAKYNFTITLSAAANETIEARSQQIIVTGAGGTGVKATITLNQTAGDPTLSVSPAEVDVPQNGAEVSVQVITNSEFTVA